MLNITELKRISREYDTPVIAISSINREYYKKPIDFNALGLIHSTSASAKFFL